VICLKRLHDEVTAFLFAVLLFFIGVRSFWLRGACEFQTNKYRQRTLQNTKERTKSCSGEEKRRRKKSHLVSLSLSRLFSIFFVTATAADPPPRALRERKRREESTNYKEKQNHNRKTTRDDDERANRIRLAKPLLSGAIGQRTIGTDFDIVS